MLLAKEEMVFSVPFFFCSMQGCPPTPLLLFTNAVVLVFFHWGVSWLTKLPRIPVLNGSICLYLKMYPWAHFLHNKSHVSVWTFRWHWIVFKCSPICSMGLTLRSLVKLFFSLTAGVQPSCLTLPKVFKKKLNKKEKGQRKEKERFFQWDREVKIKWVKSFSPHDCCKFAVNAISGVKTTPNSI